MKAYGCFVALGLLVLQANAQNYSFPLELTGIVNLPEKKQVILEKTLNPRIAVIMSEGNANTNLEVLAIQPETGSVKIKWAQEAPATVLSLKGATNVFEANRQGLILQDANSQLVLSLYTNLTKRMVLWSPRLSAVSISVRTWVTNQTEVLAVLEKALAEKGIAVVQAGEKFATIVPQKEAAAARLRAEKLSRASTNAESSEFIRPYALSWQAADVYYASHVYAKFAGWEIDPSQAVPATILRSIAFENPVALTRAEVLFAIESLLEMHGMRVVAITNNLAKMIAIPEP